MGLGERSVGLKCGADVPINPHMKDGTSVTRAANRRMQHTEHTVTHIEEHVHTGTVIHAHTNTPVHFSFFLCCFRSLPVLHSLTLSSSVTDALQSKTQNN